MYSIKYRYWSTVSKKYNIYQPPGGEEIQRLVQIKVQVAVEMSPHELVYLSLGRGVKVLELVEVSRHVQPVGRDDIRLPLDQVLRLYARDLAHSSKHV